MSNNDVALPPTAGISLCSGIAGLDIGLKQAVGRSYRSVCYVEGEAYAAATLAARMQDGALCEAPIWSDVKTFDGKPWRGKVDCVTAGYPCQPFSVAGKRRGETDPRHLWPAIAAIIADVAPVWVFLENVPNHINLGLAQVLEDLEGLGYAVEAGLFSAQECGAPHIRQRLFILAYADRERLRQQQRNKLPTAGAPTELAKDGGTQSVADTNMLRCNKGWPAAKIQQGRNGVNGSSTHVADANRCRFDGRQAYESQQRSQIWSQGRMCKFEARSTALANAQHGHLSHGMCEQDRSHRGQQRSAGLGSAAGEAECAMGRGVDGLCPKLDRDQMTAWGDGWEAGIARTATNQACRTDRLRALGNAVVPATASLAFRMLYKQHTGYAL